MLDIKIIRENPDMVKQACLNKNDKADIDKILELDDKRKIIIGETEALRAEQNKASQDIAKMKKAGEDGDYLGDKLTKGRCDSLRKMLHLKYD